VSTAPAAGRLILASASPRRLELLTRIGLPPDRVIASEIDESPLRKEKPRDLALRLAIAKGRAVASLTPGDFVLSADTVVACGRRLLPKTETEEEARACLDLLSGRSHDVFTGVAVHAPDGRMASRLVGTRVVFKRLGGEEAQGYLRSGEWRGKAGGYGVQGRAGAFVSELSGSFTGVVGLPVHETVQLLEGLGYRAPDRWGGSS
jgi:septum formation protein